MTISPTHLETIENLLERIIYILEKSTDIDSKEVIIKKHKHRVRSNAYTHRNRDLI